jgi:hypothetical protein
MRRSWKLNGLVNEADQCIFLIDLVFHSGKFGIRDDSRCLRLERNEVPKIWRPVVVNRRVIAKYRKFAATIGELLDE